MTSTQDHLKEVEAGYAKQADPWTYQSNPADAFRKQVITLMTNLFGYHFKCALDIGAGEGWITKDLPASRIYGYEYSDSAAARFPPNVNRTLHPEAELAGQCDLVVATGVLYQHYEWRHLVEKIRVCATGVIIISGVKAWEMREAIGLIPGKNVLTAEFDYVRDGSDLRQQLRVFKL